MRGHVVGRLAQNKGHVERQHLDLAKAARSEEGDGGIIVHVDDRADVWAQPQNLAVEIVANAGHARAVEQPAAGNVSDDDIGQPHHYERDFRVLGVGDPVRVVMLRNPDGQIAERVVHIAAARHETRVAQKLFADLRVEVHRGRHGFAPWLGSASQQKGAEARLHMKVREGWQRASSNARPGSPRLLKIPCCSSRGGTAQHLRLSFAARGKMPTRQGRGRSGLGPAACPQGASSLAKRSASSPKSSQVFSMWGGKGAVTSILASPAMGWGMTSLRACKCSLGSMPLSAMTLSPSYLLSPTIG